MYKYESCKLIGLLMSTRIKLAQEFRNLGLFIRQTSFRKLKTLRQCFGPAMLRCISSIWSSWACLLSMLKIIWSKFKQLSLLKMFKQGSRVLWVAVWHWPVCARHCLLCVVTTKPVGELFGGETCNAVSFWSRRKAGWAWSKASSK